MKIEIDLNNILGNEYGVETLEESVRRQVVDKLAHEIKSGIGKKIDSEISALIGSEIKVAIKDKMPDLVDYILTNPYSPIDAYGSRGKETTFRDQLIKSINENMVYKKERYGDGESVFTKAVDSVISEHVRLFEKNFKDLITKDVEKQTLDFALSKMKEKFKIEL